MKFKMYQAAELAPILTKLKEAKLPFKISYGIAMLALEIEKSLNYYNTQLRDMLNYYGEHDENGGLISTEDGGGIFLRPELKDEAYQKLEELGSLDIELPDYKFNLDAFGDIEISPQEMLILMPFIEA